MSNILLRHLSMLISTLFKHQHLQEHFLLPTGEENLPRIRDRTSAGRSRRCPGLLTLACSPDARPPASPQSFVKGM